MRGFSLGTSIHAYLCVTNSSRQSISLLGGLYRNRRMTKQAPRTCSSERTCLAYSHGRGGTNGSGGPMFGSKKIAIIGAGAAGLISAKELTQMGHTVIVFEQTESIGGVWAYTDEVEDDLLGVESGRRKVHGSMYKHLRTNLPREVMGVADFPFDDMFPGSEDPRQYCSHEEVFRYLKAYATHFDILRYVRFSSHIQHVTRQGAGWQVSVENGSSAYEEDVDAIVICNGHYSEPRVPEWPGQDTFPGIQMHSHNYRDPTGFVRKRVVVVGAAFSGSDISQEILEHGAEQVYLSARSWEDLAKGHMVEGSKVVHRVPNIKELGNDGSVTFVDGTVVDNIDIVMYATGYKYNFPFMDGIDGAPCVEDNRVYPCFQHVFPPTLAPWVSFVGLPWKVVPFPQFQLQSRWIGACLNGSAELPTPEAMQEHVDAWCQALDKQGIEKRYTHRMNPDSQGEYNNWLASQVHEDGTGWPEWRRVLYLVSGMNRRTNGLDFREYNLEDLGAQDALQEFRREAAELRKHIHK